jgi:hypothetical protein
MPKDITCKHCGKINQHHSFQCSLIRKPIKTHNHKESGSLPVVQKLKSKISPVSDKQKMRLAKYYKLRLEYLNEHQRCEANLLGCSHYATEIHHKKSKIGEDLYNNFLAICRNCHRFIHDVMPLDEAIEKGLMIRRV